MHSKFPIIHPHTHINTHTHTHTPCSCAHSPKKTLQTHTILIHNTTQQTHIEDKTQQHTRMHIELSHSHSLFDFLVCLHNWVYSPQASRSGRSLQNCLTLASMLHTCLVAFRVFLLALDMISITFTILSCVYVHAQLTVGTMIQAHRERRNVPCRKRFTSNSCFFPSFLIHPLCPSALTPCHFKSGQHLYISTQHVLPNSYIFTHTHTHTNTYEHTMLQQNALQDSNIKSNPPAQIPHHFGDIMTKR